jgi:hypothetical protein
MWAGWGTELPLDRFTVTINCPLESFSVAVPDCPDPFCSLSWIVTLCPGIGPVDWANAPVPSATSRARAVNIVKPDFFIGKFLLIDKRIGGRRPPDVRLFIWITDGLDQQEICQREASILQRGN